MNRQASKQASKQGQSLLGGMWFPKVFELWTPPFKVESIPKDYILQCILDAISKNLTVFVQVFEVSDHLRKIVKSVFKTKVDKQNNIFRTTILDIILVWFWKDSRERHWRSKVAKSERSGRSKVAKTSCSI